MMVVAACLSAAGCSVDAEGNLGDELAHNELGEDARLVPIRAHSGAAPVRVDASADSAATFNLPSAVYLLNADSPIVPWCSGVLIAPDVVVTSSTCADPWNVAAMSVGFDTPNRGAEIDIVKVVRLDADPRVTAVILDGPVGDVEPVSVVALEEDRCDVASISYLFAHEDDPSDRRDWTGCYQARTHTVTPTHGEPNCHGDAGAPVYSEPGVVAGIVVGAHSSTETCIDSVQLAVPFDGGPFEEAMALSSAPS